MPRRLSTTETETESESAYTRSVRWLFLSLLACCGGRTGLGVGSYAGDASPGQDAGKDGAVGDAAKDATVVLDCATSFVKIADTEKNPDQIVIDGAFVYWHDDKGVSRAPKAGGPAQSLAQTSATSWPTLASFALSSTDVYFVIGPGQVAMVSKQGGSVKPIPMPVPDFPGVATSTTMLYAWSTGSPGSLFSATLGGAPGMPFTPLPAATSKIAIDGAFGYAASNGGVQSIDLVTGKVTYLSGLAASDGAVDASDVYFTTIDVTNGTAIMRVPKAGGAQSKVRDEKGAYAVALDATDLYFGNRLSQSVNKIVGKTSSSVVQIAALDSTTQPIGIALDDQCVYIAAAPISGTGAIYAAPK